MPDYFAGQMDYVLFIYGLAFVILGAVSFDLHHFGRRDLQWILLGIFGVFHGFNIWLDVAALAYSFAPFFRAVQAFILVSAFVALFEFGRRGHDHPGGRLAVVAIHAVLVVLLARCFMVEPALFPAMLRYSYAFFGGLLAASALWRRAWRPESPAVELRFASVAMATYAVMTVFAVAPAPILPARILNATIFAAWTGMPVQVIKALLAILAAFLIWRHARRLMPTVEEKKHRWFGMALTEWMIILLLLGVVAGGWSYTNLAGRGTDRRERDILRMQARLAAGALNSDFIQALPGQATDTLLPEYLIVKRHLDAIRHASPKYRFSYLTIMRDEQVIFLADSEPDTSPDCSPPGQVYTEASPAMVAVLRGLPEAVDGPYEDRWGTWISGYAAIPAPSSHARRVAVGIDVDARDWNSLIAERRLPAILITMLVTLVVIMLYVLREQDEASKAALVRSERLAAVGFMATGIAHEFNNALIVILSHVELLLRDVKDAGLHQRLSVVERQAKRAAEIVKGVTVLARPLSFRPAPCFVADLVDEALEAQRVMLAEEKIEVDWRSSRERWLADPVAIHQVLMNVITNARHAMKSRQGGRLSITIGRAPGRVVLTISDTGRGMTEATLSQVFTPFFTTKGGHAHDDLGIKGVGLGMPVCHRIIQAHGGSIHLESVVEKGTSVSISLSAAP